MSLATDKFKNHLFNPNDIFGVGSTTKGEVGLELETIGRHLPEGFQKTKLWTVHNDDSVKVRSGEMAKEYVLVQPVGRPKIGIALDELLAEFALANSEVAEGRISNSVHVHINAQQQSMKQIYTWLTLYFIFEELLVRWAGSDRIGNLFCLRAKDAEALIRMLALCAKQDSYGAFSTDTYRYAAANVMALTKYGSLEFRALRGTANKQVIMTWVDALLALKDKSLEYKDPVDVMANFSQRSPMGMVVHVMPPEMRNWMLHQPDFQESMYEGARLAQDIAFATAWSTADPKKGVSKPKTRNPMAEVPGWGHQALASAVAAASDPYNSTAPDSKVSFAVVMVGNVFRKASTSEMLNGVGAIRYVRRDIHHAMRQAGYRFAFKAAPTGVWMVAVVRASSGDLARYAEPHEFEPAGWTPQPQPVAAPVHSFSFNTAQVLADDDDDI